MAIGLLLLGATVYFFVLPRLYPQPLPMDVRIIGGMSLLPLLAGLWGLARQPERRQPATQIATAIVITLAIFLNAIDVYLFILTR